ncbi:MAG TPA: DUF998 domain-containing protein [Candidatus Saccharimonadales bacterium]|nr:DUF998 domain-containing protein [Candidatus Saccharimonadales bacterium]
MKAYKTVKVFTDRFPLIGPIMWMLSVQYFLTQIFVARAWHPGYSLLQNTISDLGNTSCGIYAGHYVCSPLHSWMNASFIILGSFMALGSLLIYQEFREREGTLIGFSLMAIAGVGTIIVGLFPENTDATLHIIGATLPFLFGNIGLVIVGLKLFVSKNLNYYTLFSGIFSLVALAFFVSHRYLGLGIGGMERLTAYPQTIWLIVFGIYMSKNHILKHLRAHSRKNSLLKSKI